jgi:hypothetical protein
LRDLDVPNRYFKSFITEASKSQKLAKLELVKIPISVENSRLLFKQLSPFRLSSLKVVECGLPENLSGAVTEFLTQESNTPSEWKLAEFDLSGNSFSEEQLGAFESEVSAHREALEPPAEPEVPNVAGGDDEDLQTQSAEGELSEEGENAPNEALIEDEDGHDDHQDDEEEDGNDDRQIADDDDAGNENIDLEEEDIDEQPAEDLQDEEEEAGAFSGDFEDENRRPDDDLDGNDEEDLSGEPDQGQNDGNEDSFGDGSVGEGVTGLEYSDGDEPRAPPQRRQYSLTGQRAVLSGDDDDL